MTVIVYFVGGPLDGEHQGVLSVNNDPGHTMTITIDPTGYLDPTGGDYIPPDLTYATYGNSGMITAPAFSFNHHTPAQLPLNGHFPANWDSNGVPPTALQVVPGGSVTYSIDGTQWVYTGTGWIPAAPVDIDTDEEFVFTYVP